MDQPLNSARLKVERAKKHVNDFDEAKVSFLASDPYGVTPKFQSEAGYTVCYLDRSDPIPAMLSLIIGDAAHNLRSALDHLVVALVEANGETVTSRTAFPICETQEKYQAESPEKTKGIQQEAKHAIDQLAPFQGGNNLLWGVHELDRVDKHRLLITVASIVAMIGLEMGPEQFNRVAPNFIRFGSESVPQRTYWFDPGPQIFKIGTKQGDSLFSIMGDFEQNQNIKCTFDIALGEPNVLKACPVVDTLSAAIQVVEDTLADLMPFLL